MQMKKNKNLSTFMTVNLICVHLIRCSQAALGSACNVQIFGTVRNATHTHQHTHTRRVRDRHRDKQTNRCLMTKMSLWFMQMVQRATAAAMGKRSQVLGNVAWAWARLCGKSIECTTCSTNSEQQRRLWRLRLARPAMLLVLPTHKCNLPFWNFIHLMLLMEAELKFGRRCSSSSGSNSKN